MENEQFTRVSCWILNRTVPPMPNDCIVYYDSSWDYKTNSFITENYEQIKVALGAVPSAYCKFNFSQVEQPTSINYDSKEEKMRAQAQKAAQYKTATNPFEGTLSCALFQDKGHEDPTTQRLLIINIEDCTRLCILTAIRYMAKLADFLKDEVKLRSGSIPEKYRQMWQIDLANEHDECLDCDDLYDTVEKWFRRDNKMLFTEPMLEFDEKTHRLWFLDNKGHKTAPFVKGNLLAQAFYILVWNHQFDGVKDIDLCCEPNDKTAIERQKQLQKELIAYYKIFKPNQSDELYEDRVMKLCSGYGSENRNSLRSKIKKSFRDQFKSVDENYAEEVVEYYAFDATPGIIKVEDRSTIILPDSLRGMNEDK